MNMVERVALAISGSDDPVNILGIHRVRARAAIEAMREPTQEMVESGDAKCGVFKHGSSTWRAMIDTALK